MTDRITGRLNDGTVFVHSETGEEGVGHLTTQRRLPEIICKLARFEDKIENGELVEVRHGKWIWKELYGEIGYMLVCSECEESEGACERFDYCPNCGAIMDLD